MASLPGPMGAGAAPFSQMGPGAALGGSNSGLMPQLTSYGGFNTNIEPPIRKDFVETWLFHSLNRYILVLCQNHFKCTQ